MKNRIDIMNQIAMDTKKFRQAMGRFATGVTVITTNTHDGVPTGMTCNSFASVSLEPPLVLWSIARTSRNFVTFMAATNFAIHVLAEHQGELCKQFSMREGDRFAGLQMAVGVTGVPLLTDCYARYECQTFARYEAGDHVIVVGQVLAVAEQDGQPLLFHRGLFPKMVAGV